MAYEQLALAKGKEIDQCRAEGHNFGCHVEGAPRSGGDRNEKAIRSDDT